MSGHHGALLDWLACASGGRDQRAPRAARAAGDGLLERVAWLGTAGHVLDFDDTYLPGIAHLSAPTAPAAIAVGLQAKFSIPYLVAYVVLHGEPEPASFDGVDPHARSLAAERVRVSTDEGLRQAEAVLALDGDEVARVPASRGSPEAPMDAGELAAKCALLAGERLDGLLDDRDAPAQILLDALA